MTSTVTFKLDCMSPLLQFNPRSNWLTGEDSSTILDDGTAISTQILGSTITLQFNGTAAKYVPSFVSQIDQVLITTVFRTRFVGTRRANHGNYTVTLDGTSLPPMNGSATPDMYNTTLYEVEGLAMGNHTVSIINSGGPPPVNLAFSWLDIDWISFDTQVVQSSTNVYDDTHPALRYLPDPSAWTAAGNSAGSSNNTLTLTTSDKGVLEVDFTGDAVALYGMLDKDRGQFAVSLDGVAHDPVWGNYSSPKPQSLLYFANQLGTGKHTLRVTNMPAGPSQSTLAVDQVTVWGGSAIAQQPADAKIHPSSPPIGAIAGAAIGGVVLLAFIIGLTIFLRRRRRTWRFSHRDEMSNPGEMVDPSDHAARISPYRDYPPFGLPSPHPNTVQASPSPPSPSHPAVGQQSRASGTAASFGSIVPLLTQHPDPVRRSISAQPTGATYSPHSEAQYWMAQADPAPLRQVERIGAQGRRHSAGSLQSRPPSLYGDYLPSPYR